MNTRTIAGVAVAGQVAFVVAWATAGLLEPGYSVSSQAVSELFSHTAEYPWIVRTGIALLVPSYLATAVLLRRMLERAAWPAVGLFLLAVALVITVDLDPLDCMINASAACARRVDLGQVSTAHRVHGPAAVALQVSLVATPFALAIALRGSATARWALLVGAIGVASVVWVAVAGPGIYGVAQRTTFGFVNVWIVLIAAAAVRDGGRDTVAP